MCFSVQVDLDVQRVANRFKARIDDHAFKQFEQWQHLEPKKYKSVGEDSRLYPNVWTPVITMEKGQRTLRPMRYRVRPSSSKEEVPSKYNVFNARLDSLEKRSTWSTIFGKRHCIVPFLSFYEWVEKDGKKALINFNIKGEEQMWAPGLYDSWQSPDLQHIIHSFAIITTDPPPEVLKMGHDRCPLRLKSELLDAWCVPEGKSKKDLYHILNQTFEASYDYRWA